jgi:hypothetical protein
MKHPSKHANLGQVPQRDKAKQRHIYAIHAEEVSAEHHVAVNTQHNCRDTPQSPVPQRMQSTPFGMLRPTTEHIDIQQKKRQPQHCAEEHDIRLMTHDGVIA